MLRRAIDDSAFVCGRIECAVWHEAQLGATTSPFRSSASPWMLSEKFSMM